MYMQEYPEGVQRGCSGMFLNIISARNSFAPNPGTSRVKTLIPLLFFSRFHDGLANTDDMESSISIDENLIRIDVNLNNIDVDLNSIAVDFIRFEEMILKIHIELSRTCKD
jgi:hypothetical protein